MEIQKLINNNTAIQKSNSYPYNKTSTKSCSKLAPSEVTFLKSNQIITKFVKQGNVQQNKSTNNSKSLTRLNAYDLCKSEIHNYQQKQKEYNLMLANTDIKIRKGSYQNQLQRKQKEKQLESQVKKIELMVDTMYLKAADIMNGRNTSNYTRKLIDIQQIPLKQLKNNTCDKSLKKIEATRKTMITKSQKLISQMTFNSQRQLQASLLSDTNNTSYSSSSLLSVSLVSTQKAKNSKKDKNQTLLKKLIKRTSFQQIYNAKRRNAATDGFGKCWQLGNTQKKVQSFKLFQQIHKTSRIRAIKKRPDEKLSYLNQISNAQKCQLIVNKKYGQAFSNITDNFQLINKY